VRDPNAVGSTRKGLNSGQRGEAEFRDSALTLNGVARASAAGILFPVSIVGGYLLGKWVGAGLRVGIWPAFVGAALGAAAGFWNLYRLLRGLEGGERP